MRKLIIHQKAASPYTEELQCAENALGTECTSKDLHSVTPEFLIQNAIDVIVSNGLAPEWYYLLKGLGIVTITIDNAAAYNSLADIVIDKQLSDPSRYFTGNEGRMCGNPEIKINDIADLVVPLVWDTSFFGYPVAFVSCRHLTETIAEKINSYIHEKGIRLTEYLCNCHDSRSVRVAENNGFRFVDIRLSFEKTISGKRHPSGHQDYDFWKAGRAQIPALRKIAAGMYKFSRYYYDGNFEMSKVDEFFQNWVEKAVLGTFDDECLILTNTSGPVGFCTLRYVESDAAEIGLFGIIPDYRRRSFGLVLLENVFNYLWDRGIRRTRVVTQGRNYQAQRLYQRAGFLTLRTELWYHKWR